MKDINLTYTVEILYRKKNQDLESQVLSRAIIVKTWGHGVAKNVTFQDLANQVLKEKCKISDLLLPILDHHVHLWSRLGKPSHESSYLSLMFKFFTPKSLKTWKAKSWIVQPLSRLGDKELQQCSVSKAWHAKSWKKRCQDFRPAAAKSWQSFSLVFMSWKTKSWKT